MNLNVNLKLMLSSPRTVGSRGALRRRRRPDLVDRRLASASAPPPLVLVLIPAPKALLEAPELRVAKRRRRRRADVRVVREAAPVGGVEERERLAPARARRGVVGPQAAVDDPALVPQPVLHIPQRLRSEGMLLAPGRRRLRPGRRPLLVVGRGADPAAAGGRRPGGVAVVARGAEAGAALRVEGPPARLVRQARVRLHAWQQRHIRSNITHAAHQIN